jgi:hypothetical protein
MELISSTVKDIRKSMIPADLHRRSYYATGVMSELLVFIRVCTRETFSVLIQI